VSIGIRATEQAGTGHRPAIETDEGVQPEHYELVHRALTPAEKNCCVDEQFLLPDMKE
jgi:hypothetical protein